jgi:hypothetical protein
VWPGQVLLSQLWASAEGSRPTTSSVRWPAAIAAIVAGLILTRRAGRALGPKGALCVSLCLFSSLAFMDRSETAGIPWISGLAVIAALDRILSKGSGFVAGFWAAAAFLAGGWPPLAMILLPIIVIGRAGSALSVGLLLPPLAAFLGWSAWVNVVARTAAWGAALARPLTQGPEWSLLGSLMVLALPWWPFASLAAARSVRQDRSPSGSRFVSDWLKVAAVALVAGTVIPGLGAAARLPALAGIAVLSSAAIERLWTGRVSDRARRWALGIALAVVLFWAVLAVPTGGYLAAAVSYYRQLSVLLVVLTLILALATIESVARGDVRWALASVVVAAVFLKVAHWGIYVPERNYRLGQGPWGRAIGQWVVPNWPIYTLEVWRSDLMFATGHPVRLLSSPYVLEYKSQGQPAYVLLPRAEFDHWPEGAPRLILVRGFADEYGAERVLARTEGDLGLRRGPDAE